MSKLLIMVLAIVGTLFCLASYENGKLWNTGFNVMGHTIMFAWCILILVVYLAAHLQAKR